MKLILVALAFASSMASAAIIETTDYSCDEIRAAVKRNGWQILQTNGKPALPHYNVTHYDFNQCGGDLTPVTNWVKSNDSRAKTCPAGYRCVSKSSAYKY